MFAMAESRRDVWTLTDRDGRAVVTEDGERVLATGDAARTLV